MADNEFRLKLLAALGLTNKPLAAINKQQGVVLFKAFRFVRSAFNTQILPASAKLANKFEELN
ncbi:MAG: hypothetical protein ACI308_00205, partial [Muribaculaceae bacterium]